MATLSRKPKLTGARLEAERASRRERLAHAREFTHSYFGVQLSDVMALSEAEVTELRDFVDRLEYRPDTGTSPMATHTDRQQAKLYAAAAERAARKVEHPRVREQANQDVTRIREFVNLVGRKPNKHQSERLWNGEPASAVAFASGEKVTVLAWGALNAREHKRLRTLVAKAASLPADHFDELDAKQQIRALSARLLKEPAPKPLNALAPAGSIVIPREAFLGLWIEHLATLMVIAAAFAMPDEAALPGMGWEDDGKTLIFGESFFPYGIDPKARVSPARYQSLLQLHEDKWIVWKRGTPNRVQLGQLYLDAIAGKPIEAPERKDPNAT